MHASADVAIIGAGVVGAAVVARLASRHRCVVLEREAGPARGTTGRNSGVVHAGLYHPPEWRKTQLCVRGRPLLYEWAERYGVPYSRVGKLIVATNPHETDALVAVQQHGESVGVEGLTLLGREGLHARDPDVTGLAAIFSAQTGIIDPVALTRSLLDAAERSEAIVAYGADVSSIAAAPGGYHLETSRGALFAATVVNAAGLFADDVARFSGDVNVKVHPCRGDYFRLRRRRMHPHLVYPVKVPGAPGLGVHLTLDLDGGMRLGPDATYVLGKNDYGLPATDKRVAFAAAASRFLGHVDASHLEYESCGLRPKLRAPDAHAEEDFIIAAAAPGFINLLGIESPGLTAALAIAEEVEALLTSV